jgi:hypothetical protein
MDPDLAPDPDRSNIIELPSNTNKKNLDSYCYVKSSESESGSIDQTHGSADPDPHKKSQKKIKKYLRVKISKILLKLALFFFFSTSKLN